jgi:uncharacterized repeat protein (TIGR01451 family)
MRQKYAIAGAGLLCLCLAGYVALAWGQSSGTQPSPNPTTGPGIDRAAPEIANPIPPASPTTPIQAVAATQLSSPPAPGSTTDIPGLPSLAPPPSPLIPGTQGSTAAHPGIGAPPIPTNPAPLAAPVGAQPLAPSSQPQPGLPGLPPAPASSPILPPPPGSNPELLPGTGVPATEIRQVGQPSTPATPASPAASDRSGLPIPMPIGPVGNDMPEDPNLVPSVTADNPGGRQEPSVSIEWQGPAAAKVGQPADYSLLVRNTSNIPVHDVVLRVRIPAGLVVQGTEPKAGMENNVLVWEIGALVAKQEKTVTMKMQPASKGDLMPQAKISFSGSSVLRVRVREPKLVLKTTAPEKVLVGDQVAFTLTVTNPGDGTADQVKIQALLSEGLEHSRGSKIDFDVGSLGAGESRSVQLLCGARNGGAQKCEGMATSEGGALKSGDTVSVTVIKPHLDIAIEGPGLRYLERKALYSIKVTNPGDAPATNVTVAHVVPAGFKVLAASDGGRHDYSTRTVSWFLGEVAPAQTREVKLEVQAINPGDHKHHAVVTGGRGLRAEAEKMTKVEGLSALLVEMVDTEDPIEVGAETSYEIRITNTGSKTENDIKLIATIPDKMEFKTATGPVRFHAEGKTIVFESLEKLAPRADAIFRVTTKGTQPGIVKFGIRVNSANLIEGVVKEESTRIYSDAPESGGSVPGRIPAGLPGTTTPVVPDPMGGGTQPMPTPIPAPMPALPGAGGQPAGIPGLPPLPGGR